jgi:hypothetical protein
MGRSVIVPDPHLTLSEAVSMHATLNYFMANYLESPDVVIESGAGKLMKSSQEAAQTDPEAYEALKEEYRMHVRLRSRGRRRRPR